MDLTEEELKNALKILEKPVKVGNKLYKYFDEENYDILERVYLKCLNLYNHLETLIEIKKEHELLKNFIIEHGLYDELIKDKKILEWFDEDDKS